MENAWDILDSIQECFLVPWQRNLGTPTAQCQMNNKKELEIAVRKKKTFRFL